MSVAGPIPAVPLNLAVDLSPLRPGGENGGIRTFLFELLGWLGRQTVYPVKFTFFTNSRTHGEVRRELARLTDTLACVRVEPEGSPLPLTGWERMPREVLWPNPPLDLVARLGADVLYCPFGSPDLAGPGIPMVCTVVDVLHRDFPASLPASDVARREQFFQRLVARADRIQCNSDHVKRQMMQHYGVAPERMFLVHNVVHGRFVVTGVRATGGLPEPTGPKYFFYPANPWTHKNHEVLLGGYARYRHEALRLGESAWDLLLTGHFDEERRGELGALANELALGGSVRFAGYVAPADFGAVWAGAGALVFPSLHEGFGIPLLEAMHHGVPTASSAVCSLPEVGADACLYVEDPRSPAAWGEAMRQLATDPALRADLIARGRRRLADFSMAREGGRLLSTLLELVREHAPVHPAPAPTGLPPDGSTGVPRNAPPADHSPACRALVIARAAHALLRAAESGAALGKSELNRLEETLSGVGV